MQAHDMPLTKLINVDQGAREHFHVPKYQREYSWKRWQLEQLLNDIEDNDAGYFMGSIICVNDAQTIGPGDELIYEVVDGQQRLTTLSLLLATIHAKLAEALPSYEPEDQQDMDEALTAVANIRSKLVKRKRDGEPNEPGAFVIGRNVYFLRVQPSVQNHNLEDYKYLLSSAGVLEEQPKPKFVGIRQLARAYNYFEERAPDNVADLIRMLAKINQLMFVQITVGSQSDAFALFESLNNRGVPLSAMDIIKNKMLAQMEKKHDVDIDESFERWQAIIAAIPDAKDQERFLRHFYNAFKHREAIKVEKVPRATRSLVIRIYETLINRNAPALFDDLHHAGESDGYKAFNEAARAAFDGGLIYTASFDLTACYDSLDHGVLRHFLGRLGLGPDFCAKLSQWLEKWTATEKGIYHGHGIPQGPLSSGLLSEVVLSHFDELKLPGVDFHYLRYVDDIRLFTRNESDLRRLLVSLDLMSKDVGLFPQSGKISIHCIQDIETELRTVSNPPEPAIKNKNVDQKKLLDRIRGLTPRCRITNRTRFKYLLAHAEPSASLTARLWKILDHHPEIYKSVCNYLRRYSKLPRVPADKLVELVQSSILYQSVRAEFIDAANGRLPPRENTALAKFCHRKLWTPRSMHPDLQVAVGRFLVRTGHLSASQIAYACKAAPSWWTRAALLNAVNPSLVGGSVLQGIIAAGVLDKGRDPALSAGWKALEAPYVPPGKRRAWNKAAELLLRELGLIQRSTAAYCGVAHAFGKLDKRIVSLNWVRLFGARYSQAERQAIEAVAASGVSITNFVNLLDVFNDLLLDAVFRTDGTIGTYNLGKIGSALSSQTSRFATKFPKTFELANVVHDHRYESMASHPVIRRSGKPTKRIKFKFLVTAKKLLIAAASELQMASLV